MRLRNSAAKEEKRRDRMARESTAGDAISIEETEGPGKSSASR
jgi:hypothetical protein